MKHSPDTRASLLLRLQQPGDERAWSEFVEIYQPLVHRLARRYGIQEADARDVSQQVFLAISQSIQRFSPDRNLGSFRGWLFRIARNLMINFLTQQRRHPTGSGLSEVRELLEQQPAPGSEESQVFDREYRLQILKWAADRIQGEFQPGTWQAFWRTSVQGRPIAEVAAQLDMSVGAIYVARSRVMARLKTCVLQTQDQPPVQ